ncbi:MAG: Gfo/Idh/MocA family oxidoreductase [Pirellulales bacterium]
MSKIHQLRAGIIGSGFIGPVHIEALRRIGVQVTAICGSDRAKRVADDWAIPTVFTGHDYHSLVRCPDVDVVHITSPNRHHLDQSLAALDAGKHVVCEKPLAMNSQETDRIVQAAERSGKVFAVNYNVRFYPAVLQMRDMVQSGQLGKIIHVNGAYMQDWLLKQTDYNWRLLAQEGGELRAVGDIGTHWLDTVTFILGQKVERLLADLSTFHTTRQRPVGEVQTFSNETPADVVPFEVDTEDFANILLHFSDGCRGNLAVSQVAAGRKSSIRIEIYGSPRALVGLENPDMLHLGRRDQANAVAMRNCSEFNQTQGFSDYPGGHVEGFPDTFKMLYRSIYSAIVDNQLDGLFAGARAGHDEVLMCEAILRSHRSQCWAHVQA